MIHRGYFAAGGTGAQSDARTDPPRHFGGSATNAVYVVLVMRLLSPHYCGHMPFRLTETGTTNRPTRLTCRCLPHHLDPAPPPSGRSRCRRGAHVRAVPAGRLLAVTAGWRDRGRADVAGDLRRGRRAGARPGTGRLRAR